MRWLTMVVVFVLSVADARAAQPLVDVAWLKAHLGEAGLVILDVRNPAEYLQGHIPGSVNTDYAKSGWRVDRESDKVPEVLPADLAPLVAHIGGLGIDAASHVVVVPSGRSAPEVGVATRVYWTLKLLGLDELSLLDGGFAAWARDKANPLEAGRAEAAAKVLVPKLRRDWLATDDDVAKAVASGVMLIDARPEDYFAGINKSSKAKQAGTIPGSRNLPFTWLIDGAAFRPRPQLEFLASIAEVPATGAQIQFCNTGHLASIGWFVQSELLGNKAVRMYDGSMTEWTIHGYPVEQRIKLPQ